MQDVAPIPCGMDDFVELSSSVLGQNAGLRFQAHGNSMHPTIRHGDVILIQPAKQAKVGDVAFFRTESGRAMAHRVTGRIVKDGQTFLQTRGDACRKHDRLLSSGQLLGKVVYVERIEKGKKKGIRLDGVLARWTGLLWARFSFGCYWGYRLLTWVRRYPRRFLTSQASNAGKGGTDA